jgi:hypothetical protein
MMRRYSFYHQVTGLFSGTTFATDLPTRENLERHTPGGHRPIEGEHDHLSKRVNVATGEVIEYQPPQPSPDHAWDATAKRWSVPPEVTARARARLAAVSEIARLEAAAARPLRELALGDATAAERLREIDTQIAALRSTL